MTFHPFGDCGLLINFEQKIDIDVNQKVIELFQRIKASNLQEVCFMIPAYCSLTIGFNPRFISFSELVEKIKDIENQPLEDHSETARTLKIPVCYDDGFALDMDEIMCKTNLTKKKIVKVHTSRTYRVYMLGFLPGFAYMGTLHQSLICERKQIPRLKIAARSIGLAGSQTGIYPSEAPGGWQIIGKTPLNTFDSKLENPFLLRAGDQVKFEEIDGQTFREIERESQLGTFNIDSIYV